MISLDKLSLEGKRVLVRVDFNVPLNANLEITDDSRIQAHIPTIEAILNAGAKPILMSHLGRPNGQRLADMSLAPVAKHLESLLQRKVILATDCIGEEVEALSKNLADGEVLLLENLRYHEAETKGDLAFAQALAANGDVYLNDAFGTAHRAHASTAIIAQFFPEAKAFGLVMNAEIANASKVLKDGQSPVTAIVGGAKVSSKIGVLENLLPRIDRLIIGGGMAFTFIKAKGGDIGKSLVEEEFLDTARSIMRSAEAQDVSLILPTDCLASKEFKDSADFIICPSDAIPADRMGLDAGPQSREEIKETLLSSKTILWNGPLGVFEFDHYQEGTRSAAEYIVAATQNGAFSLIGGGDSVAAIKKFGLAEAVSYVSTGGGAMLEYLEGKELPGIKAILG